MECKALINQYYAATTPNIISGNTAEDGNGGGVYMKGGVSGDLPLPSFSALYVDILDNDALNPSGNGKGNGGGVYVGENANLSLERCSVSQNDAQYSGGGLYTDGGNIKGINQVVIEQNSATDGAGIYMDNNFNVRLDSTNMFQNTASGKGGGIYINTNNPSKSSSYCLITSTANLNANNSASSGGSVIYWENGNVDEERNIGKPIGARKNATDFLIITYSNGVMTDLTAPLHL
jgi:hypothetical protein